MLGNNKLRDYSRAPSDKPSVSGEGDTFPRSPHPQAKPSTGLLSIQLLSPFSESRKIPLFAFIVSLIKTDVSHGKSREVSPVKKESY